MFDKLDHFINQNIEAGFPSAQLWVMQGNKILKSNAYGFTNSTKEHKANIYTFYDIASLSKLFATVYPFQYLHSRQAVNLNLELAEIFPEYSFAQESQKSITISDLLSHQAGFPANPHYYDPKESLQLYCQDRSTFLEKLLLTPIDAPIKTQHRYSDVDFMLLTFILERITGLALETFLDQVFWQPLKLDLVFCPKKKGLNIQNIAATEPHGNTRDHSIDFPNVRKHSLQGEVQDEKAFHCMNEVSGHAGLFAHGKDLITLLGLMKEENDFFSQSTIDHFLQPSPLDPTFGLGWRLNRSSKMQFQFGQKASLESFGHTGWTGCCINYDPMHDLSICYLSNRKHSKVIDPKIDPNLFFADELPAGKYHNIMQYIYDELKIQAIIPSHA